MFLSCTYNDPFLQQNYVSYDHGELIVREENIT